MEQAFWLVSAIELLYTLIERSDSVVPVLDDSIPNQ
jgi:hypothetical protein